MSQGFDSLTCRGAPWTRRTRYARQSRADPTPFHSNSLEYSKKEIEMAVADKVESIIVEQLGVDADEVSADASFTDDLGADSLDIVELVMAFEEEFGIEIPDEDAENIVTVQNAVDYIEEHTS